MTRRNLLETKLVKRHNNNPVVTFSTVYIRQFDQIKCIVHKHLTLLSAVDSLHDVLQNGVHFVSRRAPTIRDRVSPSIFVSKSPSNYNCLTLKGFYHCSHRQCTMCGFAQVPQTFTSSYSGARYIVYLITCKSCKIQYVGCTTSTLKTRIRRHLSDASRPLAIGVSMVSRHRQQVHGGSTNSLKFSGIAKITRPLRGGDIRKKNYLTGNHFGFLIF